MDLLKLKKTFNKVIEEMKGIFVYLVEGISNFFKKENNNNNHKYVELNQSVMESVLYQDDSVPLIYNLNREPMYENETDSDSETLCVDISYQNTIVSKNDSDDENREDVVYGLYVDDDKDIGVDID